MENLRCADLDPIDTAQAGVEYFQVRHVEKSQDTEGIINSIIFLEREPDRVKKEVVDIVSTNVKILGK